MSDHDGVERVITMAWRAHLCPRIIAPPANADVRGRTRCLATSTRASTTRAKWHDRIHDREDEWLVIGPDHDVAARDESNNRDARERDDFGRQEPAVVRMAECSDLSLVVG